MEPWMIGLWAALGALAYSFWGFLRAYQQTRETSKIEKWSWVKTVLTILPALVAGFAAGFAMNPAGIVDVISIVIAGFGVASAGVKLGVDSFFDTK